jgi:glutaredoxin 3
MSDQEKIILYRMVLPEHECPFGLHAKQMLEAKGVEFEERILSTREEVDAFEDEHGVPTTPQAFVGDRRIGGSDDLERYLEGAA